MRSPWGAFAVGGKEEGDGEVSVAVQRELAKLVTIGCVAEDSQHGDGFSAGAGRVAPIDEVHEVVDEVRAECVSVTERLEDDSADLDWCQVRDGDRHASRVAVHSSRGQRPRARTAGGDRGIRSARRAVEVAGHSSVSE